MPLDDYLSARPCPVCHGDGEELFFAGATMREARRAAGLSVREVARRMDLSAAYVSDLELGRRSFSETLARRYLTALGVL
jgi:transcriptional regulator with XRE-family HTH domain